MQNLIHSITRYNRGLQQLFFEGQIYKVYIGCPPLWEPLLWVPKVGVVRAGVAR